MSSQIRPVTHAIFDVDGLLLDTETVYEEVYRNIAKKYGKYDYPWEVRQKILGKKETDSAAIFIKEMGLPLTVEEFRTIQSELQYEGLLNSAMMPGAEKLILHLKQHNIPMAIASSSSIESIKIKFEKRKQIFQCFSHAVCGTTDPEVKEGKPAPDIFLVCASRFPDKPDPSNCLVFEDAPSGVTGALKAGMQVVMVPDEKLDEELKKNATITLKSLNDFRPEVFNLPPFEV